MPSVFYMKVIIVSIAIKILNGVLYLHVIIISLIFRKVVCITYYHNIFSDVFLYMSQSFIITFK